MKREKDLRKTKQAFFEKTLKEQITTNVSN